MDARLDRLVDGEARGQGERGVLVEGEFRDAASGLQVLGLREASLHQTGEGALLQMEARLVLAAGT